MRLVSLLDEEKEEEKLREKAKVKRLNEAAMKGSAPDYSNFHFSHCSKMIKYLLTNTKMEVNGRNANGFTALDLLLHSQRDLRDMEIKECLQKAGALRMTKVHSIANNQEIEEVLPPIQAQPLIPKETNSKPVVEKHKHTDWLGRKRSALMVVASLLATVAFQASLSPPGGVWTSENYAVPCEQNFTDDMAGDDGTRNIIRMTLWLLRKYGYIKEKEKEFSLYVEEEE
ncbi:PGG domain - like 10 [Theobroma cacao]|nr:PGG domain - like 10 [Theobroma cacao]